MSDKQFDQLNHKIQAVIRALSALYSDLRDAETPDEYYRAKEQIEPLEYELELLRARRDSEFFYG